MKIKFKRYDVTCNGHNYCILIPTNTEQLWVTGYGSVHWGITWEGNRNGLEAILYSSVILGFNPAEKIVYFPIRKNEKTEYEKKAGAKSKEESYIEDFELVFTTHQVQLHRSEWKKIKKTLQFQKSTAYVLDYDEERTEEYFQKSLKKWKKTTAYYKKEYCMEVLEGNTLFYVWSRRQFQNLYLEVKKFLSEELEKDFEEYFNGSRTNIMKFVNMHATYYKFRNKKQIRYSPELLYYDKKYDERVKVRDEELEQEWLKYRSMYN